jgi:hypothetical protein
MLEEQKSQKSMPSLNLSQASLCQDSRYNAETEIHPSLTLFAAIRMQDLVRRSAVGMIPQSQTRSFGLSVHVFEIIWSQGGKDPATGQAMWKSDKEKT